MSHEIETHGTQTAAVFARKDAWHRLGTTVRDRAFTAEEAMRLGHLGGCYAGDLFTPNGVGRAAGAVCSPVTLLA
ncbi:hypothetical protein [Nocardioides silvaticus]|uniref:hypothetical protein n=1 Tax=Nocardioides silvaticus TaxID=2201891 RepID=UPI001FE61039|nr:hypothetical protein [Nocardioides silvaticus]